MTIPVAGRMTVPAIRSRKRRDGSAPLVMITAYDTPTARCADRAGVDMVLVGDSVGTVVLGHADALAVAISDMAHHVAAVARARARPLLVGDLPWLTYHTGRRDALRNAARLIRAGADAVKLEGDRPQVAEALAEAGIPVMAHLGVTPQSSRMTGRAGSATTEDDAAEVLDAATRMATAGCFAVLLSCVPGTVGAAATETLEVPVISYGAGPACDGQVLVLHDVIGLGDGDPPKFARRYAQVGDTIARALSAYATDVRSGRFPSPAETFSAGEGVHPATDAGIAGRAGVALHGEVSA